MATTCFVLSLVSAAAMDVKRGKVPNWIWIPALGALPLALYRILAVGWLFIYGLQVGLVFALMLLCFHVGLLGGADGKAIIIISLVYPWLEIDYLLLGIGSLVVCLGALAIEGIQCLSLTVMNLYEWHRCPLPQRQTSHPECRRFWLTRRLSRSAGSRTPSIWKETAVPFVLYVLVAYLALLQRTMVV